MKKRILIAADHGGFELKEFLKKEFQNEVEWVDLGTHSVESVDYPLFAEKLCTELKGLSREELLEPCGVLLCGSGVGISIKANRYPWIRAALVTDPEVAKLSRQHNAANVLCLGGRFTSERTAREIFKQWLITAFEGGRHQRRVDLLK